MKKLILLLAVAFVFASGCKKTCDGVLCLNGGICHNGICSCINGYTGGSCETAPVVTPACQTNHTGSFTFTNNKDNPYDIFQNGIFFTNQQGHTYSTWSAHASGYFTFHCVQSSGYVLYPTIYDVSASLSDCGYASTSIP